MHYNSKKLTNSELNGKFNLTGLYFLIESLLEATMLGTRKLMAV